ncbi:MAG: hypothetical protein QM770_24990 [Tepidisphaeraceae bacterium]
MLPADDIFARSAGAEWSNQNLRQLLNALRLSAARVAPATQAHAQALYDGRIEVQKLLLDVDVRRSPRVKGIERDDCIRDDARQSIRADGCQQEEGRHQKRDGPEHPRPDAVRAGQVRVETPEQQAEHRAQDEREQGVVELPFRERSADGEFCSARRVALGLGRSEVQREPDHRREHERAARRHRVAAGLFFTEQVCQRRIVGQVVRFDVVRRELSIEVVLRGARKMEALRVVQRREALAGKGLAVDAVLETNGGAVGRLVLVRVLRHAGFDDDGRDGLGVVQESALEEDVARAGVEQEAHQAEPEREEAPDEEEGQQPREDSAATGTQRSANDHALRIPSRTDNALAEPASRESFAGRVLLRRRLVVGFWEGDAERRLAMGAADDLPACFVGHAQNLPTLDVGAHQLCRHAVLIQPFIDLTTDMLESYLDRPHVGTARPSR